MYWPGRGVTSHNDRTGRLAVYASTCAHVCNDVLPLGEALRRGVLESCAAWDGGITIEANFESASSLQFENLQGIDVLKVFPFGMLWFGNELVPWSKGESIPNVQKVLRGYLHVLILPLYTTAYGWIT
jgi:hypothetical protein